MKTFKSLMTAFVIMIAVATVYASDLTSSSKTGFNTYPFHKLATAPVNSTNPLDYVYDPTAACDPEPDNVCTASWSQTNAPTTKGEHPTGTFVSNLDIDVVYIPSP